MHSLVKWVWRGYFSLLILFFLKLCPWQYFTGIEDLLDTGMMLASLVAFFGFVFNRPILRQGVWRLFFITLVMWDFYYHFIIQSLATMSIPSWEVLGLLFFLTPLYLGIFAYAFLHWPAQRQKEVSLIRGTKIA